MPVTNELPTKWQMTILMNDYITYYYSIMAILYNIDTT